MAGVLSLSATLQADKKGGVGGAPSMPAKGVIHSKQRLATWGFASRFYRFKEQRKMRGKKTLQFQQITVCGMTIKALLCGDCGARIWPIAARHNCGAFCLEEGDDFSQKRRCFNCKREFSSWFGKKRCPSCLGAAARGRRDVVGARLTL